MADDITKMSDQTQVAMPIRNIISIVASVAVATWAYSGVIERLNRIEQTNHFRNRNGVQPQVPYQIARGEMGVQGDSERMSSKRQV